MLFFAKSGGSVEPPGLWLAPPMVIPGVILSNITSSNDLLLNSYFKILPLDYMLYMFLTFMPIFMSIGCYLPFDS